MKDEYRVKVREDIPIGTVITNLVARDPDLPESGGDVSYKILNGEEPCHNRWCLGVCLVHYHFKSPSSCVIVPLSRLSDFLSLFVCLSKTS